MINSTEPITDYLFETNEALQTAVDLWISDESLAISTYGHISSWDTSLITDMSNLFKFVPEFQWPGGWTSSTFNENISGWNTSNVTDMSGMFNGAALFDQDISGWNTSNVTNMSYMFSGTFPPVEGSGGPGGSAGSTRSITADGPAISPRSCRSGRSGMPDGSHRSVRAVRSH